MKPYYADESVTLYHGDCREVVPVLAAVGFTADTIITDPPYGETALPWDRWPDGWVTAAALVSRSLWCFGSLRMFVKHLDEFTPWVFSQELVWEKHNGSGFARDRFMRVHELIGHWYRGDWRSLHHEVPVRRVDERSRRKWAAPSAPAAHRGQIASQRYDYDGERMERSVLAVRSMHGRALHPTEKPAGIVTPLVTYSCPPGGVVLDMHAGSGAVLDAARQAGRRSVGVELTEQYCEVIARRLSQGVLL